MIVSNFADWREQARGCLARASPPRTVDFRDLDAPPELFAVDDPSREPSANASFRVAKKFLGLAETVSYHRDRQRWNLLYRVLWRLTHGETNVLDLVIDPDVARLLAMEKAVRRDAHKMKAFVRFRRVTLEREEHFIAWHRPDHRIVRMTAPFFARRFPEMRWSILTPDESVSWDLSSLTYGPGVPSSEAPPPDMLEDLWRAYYASTFNPARINLPMMRKEMPVRHWPTLPETALIPQMLADAPLRVSRMMARAEGSAVSAADFIPSGADWLALREAAASCRGCDLCQHATQTVFGEGPPDARVVLIGEQPGDQEDRTGRPFVGPAGEVLDVALADAGIDRTTVYVTNAVKHFKYEPRGKARLHKKPNVRETIACRPWLLAELELIQPKVIVCLGATAAQSVIGRDFRIHQRRGEVVATELCRQTIATYHPASILRVPNRTDRDRLREALVADLLTARKLLSSS